MNNFLKEAYELWYWAMFCPSRLEQRMNSWSPKNDSSTRFDEILLTSVHWRFFRHFFCLICIFSLPLISLLLQSTSASSWLLLPTTVLLSYGLAIFFLPIGLNIPLLIGILYGLNADRFTQNLQFGLSGIVEILPPISQLFQGIGISLLLLSLAISIVYWLIENDEILIASIVFSLSNTAIILFGGYISTRSISFSLLLGAVASCSSYILQSQLNDGENSFGVVFGATVVVTNIISVGVAIGIAFSILVEISFGISDLVAIGITFVAAFGVAVVTTIVVANVVIKIFTDTFLDGFVNIVPFGIANFILNTGTFLVVFPIAFGITSMVLFGVLNIVLVVSNLPIWALLAITAITAFSFSYVRKKLWSIPLTVILVLLGFENLGLKILWILPIVFSFYYRILPEYPLLTAVISTPNFNLRNIQNPTLKKSNLEQWLQRLPPFSSELLWLPIPGHAQLLAKVFKINSVLGLDTLQQMQSSSLPGLALTAQSALPNIVADQLLEIENLSSLRILLPETLEDRSSNLLKILLPTYYETTLEEISSKQNTGSELAVVFPRLQGIAQDIDAAIKANNDALRERGLERILGQLELLRISLNSLGLKINEVNRWQTVINRWYNLLELELSQGEISNPFYFGNPLQPEQSHLFKGRHSFADKIARLLLGRNRPTIVLHGPRRCGKTSFLYNLPRLLPNAWVPVFVDMQSAAVVADDSSFFSSLAEAIYDDSKIQGIQLPEAPDRELFKGNPYRTFETWLAKVLEQLGERQLLLNLDEFEKISVAIHQGKLTLAIFDEFRSLIQHWSQLGFIFSGVQTLEEIAPDWHSYFISVIPIEMLYLENEEACELLTNPDPKFNLVYASGVLEAILELTQCHPYLLQLLGASLVEEVSEQHTQTATIDILEDAIHRAFELGCPYFTNVWGEFTGNPESQQEVKAGQLALKALADNKQPIEPNVITKTALHRMLRYHVLTMENDQYEFDIPLIKRWVKERAIIEDT